jgi:hypothetical protein
LVMGLIFMIASWYVSSVAAQPCPPADDMSQDGRIIPVDALLAFQ